MYQLDDLNRSKKDVEGGGNLIAEKYESEKKNFIKKMNEMSKLLMNEEGEKLRLSE